MKVLITGAGGQVGKSLVHTVPTNYSLDARTHQQLDLDNVETLKSAVANSRPNYVINAAAYTAVDRAEAESARAHAINATAVGALAEICKEIDAKLIHISTDYVFDGRSIAAYETDAQAHPLNVYGTSKWAGEQRLVSVSALDHHIVRTSWVYSPVGHNFVLTMLKLFRERGAASVVCDQIGAPTSALSLARFLWHVVATPSSARMLHYTDAGVASWYDFAVAIGEEAFAAGLLPRVPSVTPIVTADYPTPAKRPRMSILSTQSSLESVPCAQPHWRSSLRETIALIGSKTT